ncbi:hemerythrin domain-containing protein [Thermithiobacillus plumbiphilus]|uniref:Hemerythrin domain-containing protein n=1 Tax=Thermithiobacillus plumbiphilus TaxID=1729899 RepID=A0ABU9D855_9PROT
METLSQIFTEHHHLLDRLFDAARASIKGGDWMLAEPEFQHFRREIEKHMAVEESYLFPAMTAGADAQDIALVEILRKGHQDLRSFFEEILEAILSHDAEEALALMDTVSIILEQHDKREEDELYPAVDRLFTGQRGPVLQAVQLLAA